MASKEPKLPAVRSIAWLGLFAPLLGTSARDLLSVCRTAVNEWSFQPQPHTFANWVNQCPFLNCMGSLTGGSSSIVCMRTLPGDPGECLRSTAADPSISIQCGPMPLIRGEAENGPVSFRAAGGAQCCRRNLDPERHRRREGIHLNQLCISLRGNDHLQNADRTYRECFPNSNHPLGGCRCGTTRVSDSAWIARNTMQQGYCERAFHRPNENKMSDGWRKSVSPRIDGGISSQVRNQSCQSFAPSHG